MEDLRSFLFRLERDTLVEILKKLGLEPQGNDSETFRIAKLRDTLEKKILLFGLTRLVKRLELKHIVVLRDVLDLASLDANEDMAQEILDFGFTEKVLPRLPEKTLFSMAKATGLHEKLPKEEVRDFMEDETVIRGTQAFLRSIPLPIVKYILEDLDLYTWGKNKEVRVNRVLESVFDLEPREHPDQSSDDEEPPVQQPSKPKPPVKPVEPVFKKPEPVSPKVIKRKASIQPTVQKKAKQEEPINVC